jgi:hypothetical protein
MCTPTVILAKRFHALVREEFADHLDEIDAMNAEDEDCCATHAFCDPNEVMAEAFVAVVGRSVDVHSDADLALWNSAWTFAKHRGFSRRWSCSAS